MTTPERTSIRITLDPLPARALDDLRRTLSFLDDMRAIGLRVEVAGWIEASVRVPGDAPGEARPGTSPAAVAQPIGTGPR
jgi:hypothetical protein